MNYKKATFWLIILAVCVCMVVAVCFLTNPSDNQLHAPEPFGHTYRVEEILYSAPQYSFSYSTETAPSYCFTADYVMFVSADVLNPTTTEEWIQQNGSFEEVKITTENFDNYFKTYDNVSGWNVNNDTWSKFRSSIDKSWRLCVENNEQNVFYYFILTKSGDVYLSYGYDVDNSNNIVEEDSLIRWLFKLTRTDMLEEYRTEYLGDAPNVSAIAQRLPYPSDYTYSSIELQTSAEPYELIIYLNGNEDVSSEDFKECADIALDLIGNMDMITFIDAKTENRLASYNYSYME